MTNDKILFISKVLVRNSSGEILILRRGVTDTIRPLTWDLPGGIVEFGEDPKQAVIRECKEETGLEIKPPRILETIYDNRSKHLVELVYLIEIEEVKKIELSFEHDKYNWVNKNELLTFKMPPAYKKLAEKLT